MTDARLPAHLEIAGFLRAVEAAGGFGVVLQRGERDAGTIVLVTTDRGERVRLWERMPQIDGTRQFTGTREADLNNPSEFGDYLARRMNQDLDCWFIELDIPDATRFIASLGT